MTELSPERHIQLRKFISKYPTYDKTAALLYAAEMISQKVPFCEKCFDWHRPRAPHAEIRP